MIKFYIDTFKEIGLRGSLAILLIAFLTLVTSYGGFIIALKIGVFFANL